MNLKPRITDVCFSLDCDVDKMKHLLTDIDDCTTGGKKSVCEYIALSEQINTITAILFDYCAKVKDQIQEIDELSDKATAESREEFEQEFQQHMNPPITQELDTKKNQPLAMEVIADEVKSRCLVREIVSMVCDPDISVDALRHIRDAVWEIRKTID